MIGTKFLRQYLSFILNWNRNILRIIVNEMVFFKLINKKKQEQRQYQS